MRKNILYLLALVFAQMGIVLAQDRPKYIFFMIGDGMGLNQVHITEAYQAAMAGRNTAFPLTFTQFPYATFATSYSLSHPVTDSAAGGTALAVGYKTKNGVVGMDSTATIPYKSIAYYAKEAGMKVGITTSVTIDHATPASFYAHQAHRSMGYEIGLDLIRSDFDFFGGSGFSKITENSKKEKVESLLTRLERAGYTLAYGQEAYEKAKVGNDKIILMNDKGGPEQALTFAIDRKPDELTLAQITAAAVESLTKDNENGFFLMVEGGEIDWACHGNDGATAIQETLDFDAAVKVAFEFYKKHPRETLIVVTADHETGGMAMTSNGQSLLSLRNIAHQKISQNALSERISALRKNNPKASWEIVKRLLSDNLGLWTAVKVSEADEREIREAYTRNFVENKNETEKNLYSTDSKIAALAVRALNKAAGIGWSTSGHSAAYIPVYAIGPGAHLFSHKMENIDIPRKVAQAAGWYMHLLAAEEFRKNIQTLDEPLLLDVRTAQEYNEGHLENALNIAWDEEDFRYHADKLDRTRPVLVYCQGGVRSAAATKALAQAGFRNVYELDGGIAEWQKAQLPVTK